MKIDLNLHLYLAFMLKVIRLFVVIELLAGTIRPTA
jgi:hypothetical protein